jgi:hypothetical protein
MTQISRICFGHWLLIFGVYLIFVILNLNSSIGEEDGRIPLLEGLSQRMHPLYPHLADATGRALYEGVPGPSEEVFFSRDV